MSEEIKTEAVVDITDKAKKENMKASIAIEEPTILDEVKENELDLANKKVKELEDLITKQSDTIKSYVDMEITKNEDHKDEDLEWDFNEERALFTDDERGNK